MNLSPTKIRTFDQRATHLSKPLEIDIATAVADIDPRLVKAAVEAVTNLMMTAQLNDHTEEAIAIVVTSRGIQHVLRAPQHYTNVRLMEVAARLLRQGETPMALVTAEYDETTCHGHVDRPEKPYQYDNLYLSISVNHGCSAGHRTNAMLNIYPGEGFVDVTQRETFCPRTFTDEYGDRVKSNFQDVLWMALDATTSQFKGHKLLPALFLDGPTPSDNGELTSYTTLVVLEFNGERYIGLTQFMTEWMLRCYIDAFACNFDGPLQLMGYDEDKETITSPDGDDDNFNCLAVVRPVVDFIYE